MTGERNINIDSGNYNEKIQENYIQGGFTIQEIFKNVRAGGEISEKDIQIIYQTAKNLSNIPKPAGFPQNIPNSNTKKYIGRETELKFLHQQLQSNNQVAITTIEGMGGVGKTELAVQYSLLHLQLHSYPGGICWLKATKSNIGLKIIEFVRINFDLQPPDDLEISERVRWCWKHWHQGNTLIVVDDVKNYREIKPLLPPQSSQFKVLITTRLKLSFPTSLYLQVLSASDALKLLTQLLEEEVNNEPEKSQELCQFLGNLPLSLQLVAGYVWKLKISLSEMLLRLEEKRLAYHPLVVEENDSVWSSDIKLGVASALELSWLELSESAQKLGCLLSLFAASPIEWWLVEKTAAEQDSEDLEDARIELEDLHLLSSDETYQLHQLIREFLQDKLQASPVRNDLKQAFTSTFIEIAQKISESPTLDLINYLINAIPHLAEVAENHLDTVSDQNLISAFTGLGWFYQEQGLYSLAQPWYQECLSTLCKRSSPKVSRLGDNHSDTATSLNNLANLYKSQGKYKQAKTFYIQALELTKQLLGENHPHTATSLNDLALFYNSQGKYEQAEPLYIQALKLTKQLHGLNHPHTVTILNNLALLYNSQGKYEQAELFYIQALELTKQLLGVNHPDTTTSLNNLAALYQTQGKYDEAEPLYIQALELTKQLHGLNHPHTATSLNNLAFFYEAQGKYEETEPLYIQALESYKQLLGENHPSTATSLNNLALLYDKQGRYEEAQPLYIQALEILERILGKNHPNTVTCRENLGYLYVKQQQNNSLLGDLKK